MISVLPDEIKFREVQAAIGGFAEDASNLTSIWPDVAKKLEALTVWQFTSVGADSYNGAWAELSENYWEWKAKKFPGKPILQRDGRLMDSFSEGHPDHVQRATEMTLDWGSSVDYSVYHETGYDTRLGKGKGKPKENGIAHVPARRPIDFTNEQVQELVDTIHRGILNYARRRGFATARGAYGPGEMQEVGPGEAFQMGKSAMAERL